MIARKGPEGFESHYRAVYGERWPGLRDALLGPVRQIARLNAFADRRQIDARAEGFARATFAGAECVLLDAEGKRLEPKLDPVSGLFDCYIMDPASIFAAAAVEPQAGDEILDLCAAPGGKSLVLAERLGETGVLVANEMSDRRRARLRAVLEDYLPKERLSRVRVTGHDGARWCLHETNAFDRILVDAPCSGERHILTSPEELKLWSPARSKNLFVRQYALLVSALQVVRPGGRIVYSTCSISPLENDDVISRLLKKRGGEARVLETRLEIGEATQHGWALWPDRTGFGPIYFVSLEKL